MPPKSKTAVTKTSKKKPEPEPEPESEEESLIQSDVEEESGSEEGSEEVVESEEEGSSAKDEILEALKKGKKKVDGQAYFNVNTKKVHGIKGHEELAFYNLDDGVFIVGEPGSDELTGYLDDLDAADADPIVTKPKPKASPKKEVKASPKKEVKPAKKESTEPKAPKAPKKEVKAAPKTKPKKEPEPEEEVEIEEPTPSPKPSKAKTPKKETPKSKKESPKALKVSPFTAEDLDALVKAHVEALRTSLQASLNEALNKAIPSLVQNLRESLTKIVPEPPKPTPKKTTPVKEASPEPEPEEKTMPMEEERAEHLTEVNLSSNGLYETSEGLVWDKPSLSVIAKREDDGVRLLTPEETENLQTLGVPVYAATHDLDNDKLRELFTKMSKDPSVKGKFVIPPILGPKAEELEKEGPPEATGDDGNEDVVTVFEKQVKEVLKKPETETEPEAPGDVSEDEFKRFLDVTLSTQGVPPKVTEVGRIAQLSKLSQAKVSLISNNYASLSTKYAAIFSEKMAAYKKASALKSAALRSTSTAAKPLPPPPQKLPPKNA